ncbi:MAG: DUF1109 domain-containing protein [Burkholderiaceae bacterium]|nr:DUF1109 domain-containing protein [Burkholderiaceae bacterium]
MRTDDLIDLLAQGAAPVSRHTIEQRFAVAAMAGLAGAFVLMLALFGLRGDWAHTLFSPMLWVKLLFAVALAIAGVAALRRLARPGLRLLGHNVVSLVVPPLGLWMLAMVVLGEAEPGQRLPLIFGSTWRTCPFNIAALSAPALAAFLWALRGAAPIRPVWAGAGAGVLAGALAIVAYALHCPEMEAPFLAVWYVTGIAIPAGVGAVLGPRVLRW